MPEDEQPRDVSEDAIVALTEQLDTLLEGMSAAEAMVTLQGLRDVTMLAMDDIVQNLLYGDGDEEGDIRAGLLTPTTPPTKTDS